MIIYFPKKIHTRIVRRYITQAASAVNIQTISLPLLCALGTVGAIFLCVGSFGAGDRPTRGNPENYLIFFNFLRRMPTTSAAVVYMGETLLGLAWMLLIKFNYDIRYPRRKNNTPKTSINIWEKYLLSPKFYICLIALWVFPRLWSYPLFSQDVYSYFAQGHMYLNHYDPYVVGPGDSLGSDSIFTASVPSIWWYSPTPYGPIFIFIAKYIAQIMGTNFLIGLALYKVASLISLVLIIFFGLRIVKKIHADAVSFLLFGVLNPAILFNIIDSLHNDSWSVALAFIGIDLYVSARNSMHNAKSNWIVLLSGAFYCSAIIVVAAGALIKMPVLIMLLFMGIDYCLVISDRYGIVKIKTQILLLGGLGVVTGLLFIGFAILVGQMTHLGLGWVHALKGGNTWSWVLHLFSWMIDDLGKMLCFGSHSTTITAIVNKLPTLVFLLITCALSIKCFFRSINFIQAMGFTLLSASLLMISEFHTWYFMWWIPLLALWWPSTLLLPVFIGSEIWSFINHPGGHSLTSGITLRALASGFSPFAIFLGLTLYLYYRSHRTGHALTNVSVSDTKKLS